MATFNPKLPLIYLPFLFIYTFFLSTVSAATTPRLRWNRRFPWQNIKPESSLPMHLQKFYYKQTLDHFNYRPESYTTFQQKYVLYTKFWGGANVSAPIFVYLGAEEPIDSDVDSIGFIFDYAPKFNALILFIEHRYYGESAPFGSLDNAFSNTSTLGYFTSAQALADYAEVIDSLKKNLSAQTSPVIVMGGSYGGMLASWFRLKYPHITLGALASSAPILYSEDLTPQDAYFVVASNDFKEASKNCHDNIKQSWSKIDEMASKANGLKSLKKIFKICGNIKDPSSLKGYLEGIYSHAAQYDAPPDYPVKMICDAIDKASKTTTDVLTRVAAGVEQYKANNSCHELDGSPSTTEADDGWLWQTCTDLILPIGRDRANTMYPVSPYSIKNKTKACRDLFNVTPRPHWLLTEFGGRDIKHVLKKFGSNIIFSNGLRDPYSAGGVLHNISDSIVVVITKQGSHCLDLQNTSKDDPKWLLDMRNAEAKIIKGWIAAYYAMIGLKSNDFLV